MNFDVKQMLTDKHKMLVDHHLVNRDYTVYFVEHTNQIPVCRKELVNIRKQIQKIFEVHNLHGEAMVKLLSHEEKLEYSKPDLSKFKSGIEIILGQINHIPGTLRKIISTLTNEKINIDIHYAEMLQDEDKKDKIVFYALHKQNNTSITSQDTKKILSTLNNIVDGQIIINELSSQIV